MINNILEIEMTARGGGGSWQVRLIGEVDVSVSARLADALRASITQPGVVEVDVDLHELRFLDACGISTLPSALDLATVTGFTQHVSGCSGLADTVLRLTGVAERLGMPVIPDETAAIMQRDR
jgi:anti-anti-sigma factor